MLNLKQIQKKLVTTNIAEVSRETGVHVQSLYKVRDGDVDPKNSTLEKLTKYFEREEKCAK